jgi:hypothetical protein
VYAARIVIPLVACLVNKFSIVDAAFDLVCGFGPAQRLGVVVPVGEEAGDGLLQSRDAPLLCTRSLICTDRIHSAKGRQDISVIWGSVCAQPW